MAYYYLQVVILIISLLQTRLVCGMLYGDNSFHGQNTNPISPPGLRAHVFLYGGGTVELADGDNPFANNALDGRDFLLNEMGFTVAEIEQQKQNALTFWDGLLKIDTRSLEAAGSISIIEYQISPLVDERAFIVNALCLSPAEGLRVVDGGFQLLVTDINGINGTDPISGRSVLFPPFTNIVFAWLRIKDCGATDIVLPYKSSSLATFTLETIVFELSIDEHPMNPFGTGKLLGTTSPIVATSITNRLLNYITFDR